MHTGYVVTTLFAASLDYWRFEDNKWDFSCDLGELDVSERGDKEEATVTGPCKGFGRE